MWEKRTGKERKNDKANIKIFVFEESDYKMDTREFFGTIFATFL